MLLSAQYSSNRRRKSQCEINNLVDTSYNLVGGEKKNIYAVLRENVSFLMFLRTSIRFFHQAKRSEEQKARSNLRKLIIFYPLTHVFLRSFLFKAETYKFPAIRSALRCLMYNMCTRYRVLAYIRTFSLF